MENRMTGQTHTLDLSRRGLLRRAGLIVGAGALVGAGLAATSAAADSKFSQAMAKYQPTPKGAAHCSNCSQFVPDTACKVVAGTVTAYGWCALWVHS
jgi:hypothetical protein